MRAGWQLDDVPTRLPWRALFAFIQHLGPESAYYRQINPEYAQWTGPELLPNIMASVLDGVNILIWQNSKDGSRGRNKPKPIQRPWSKPVGQVIGNDPIPISAWDAWWGDGS